jgi:hypothetical protein
MGRTVRGMAKPTRGRMIRTALYWLCCLAVIALLLAVGLCTAPVVFIRGRLKP